MIVPTYENFRVVASMNEYGASPSRGADGRFVFPTDVVGYPSTGMLVRNVANQTIDTVAEAAVFPWELTVNSRVGDSVARTDEFDWFLWHEAGWLELRRDPEETFAATHSGSAWLYLTAAGLAEYANVGFPVDSPAWQRNVSTSIVRKLLRSSYVYASRRSDGRAFVFDLSALAYGGSIGNVLPET